MAQDGRLTRRVMGMLSTRLPEVGLESVADPRNARGKQWPLPALLNGVPAQAIIQAPVAGRVAPTAPTEPSLWADVPVSISDSDITGLAVTLRAGARISGRIEFDGATPKPALDKTPSPVTITLQPIGRSFNVPLAPATIGATGQFTTMSLPPGRYQVLANAPGWTLKAAMLNGRDVADVPLDLEAADLGGLVVTFFDRPSQISGTVRNARGEAADGASIMIIPVDYRALIEGASNGRRVRSGRAGVDGRYSFTVLPGEYYIGAFSDDMLSGGDPARIFEAIARGSTRVTIGESDKRTQDLTIR